MPRIAARRRGSSELACALLSADATATVARAGRPAPLVAAFIVYDLVQRKNPTTRGGYGRDVVQRGQLRYAYEELTTLDQAGSRITAPAGGLDPFAPRIMGDTLRLQTPTGEHECIFTPDRQAYSQRGQIVRVWRRVRNP